jgi:hypothetical protein
MLNKHADDDLAPPFRLRFKLSLQSIDKIWFSTQKDLSPLRDTENRSEPLSPE